MTVLTEKVKDLCADLAHVEVRVLLGSPWIEIIREVLRNRHDIVVKAGEAARGLLASPFGSTAAHLVRKCPCPVWLVKPGAQPRAKRILAAISPDPESGAAIQFNRQLVEIANRMGEMHAADVVLLHVWDERGYSVPRLGTTGGGPLQQATKGLEEAVTKTMVRFLEEVGLPDLERNIRLVRGDPGLAIAEFARDHEIDLIVIGSMGRVGVKGVFIGNVAEAVLRMAPCSLLTVKPEGFVTPVAPGDSAL
jgi:nucleotide-binding universal stress UspA family protein